MIKRTGAYTIAFESQPVIAGWGSVVGKKEAEGPLKNYFDKIIYAAMTAVTPLNRRKYVSGRSS